MDFTVAGIKNINTNQQEYADSFYNIVEKGRIFSSLSPEVQQKINSTRLLNGQTIRDGFCNSFKTSLVLGEDSDFSVDSINNLADTQAGQIAPSEKTFTPITDNTNAISLIKDKSLSLDPNQYQIKTKNRLLTWWSLAEDLNKRVIYKTSDLSETNIYTKC